MFNNIKALSKQIQNLEAIVHENRKMLVYFVKQLQIIFDHLLAVSNIIDNNSLKNEKTIYISNKNIINTQKIIEYMEIINQLEDELEKYKDDIIPGTVGES